MSKATSGFGPSRPIALPHGVGRYRGKADIALVASRRRFMGTRPSLVPRAARVAVLVNPSNATNTETTLRHVEPAARAIGLQLRVLNASTSREIDTAFATFHGDRTDALFVGQDVFFVTRRVQLANLSSRHAIPAVYGQRDYVEAGGLMSYGSNFTDAHREMGIYTGRILNGAKPTDLPVVQSSKLELLINLPTARAVEGRGRLSWHRADRGAGSRSGRAGKRHGRAGARDRAAGVRKIWVGRYFTRWSAHGRLSSKSQSRVMPGFDVGHRLISALILLNALGLVLCVVLITAAISSDDPARVAQVSDAVKLCLRLFVAGAALPTVAWGLLAFEFDRSHSKKKLFESAIIYAVLIISLILFCIAGWRLPQAFITGLYITE